MKKKVVFGREGQKQMLEGATILAEAVRSTMGPSGHNVIIDNRDGSPYITKDGVTVARSIELKDSLQSVGAELIKEVASKTNEMAGDGTTTATVLAHAILENGVRQVSSGRSAIELKKGIDLAKEEAISYLLKNAVKCRDASDIKNVGTISANGDGEIGTLLADAISTVGADGLVSIELAKSVNTTLELAEGMQVDAGFSSPYFITDAEKNVCEFENPYVLLTTNTVNANKDIINILERVLETERPILIFSDGVEGEALHTLIANKMKGILRVCTVKTPSYGEYRVDILNDIAALTGGEVIGAATTTSLANMKLDHLGSAKKVIVSKTGTTFIAHDDRKDNVTERVELLRSQLQNPSLDELAVNKLRSRLAKLSGGVAVIRVGGATEIEIIEKKDRVEDAVNATQAAAQEGIVSGGGCALFYTAQHLKKFPAMLRSAQKPEDLVAGVEIVIAACEAPMKQIIENTGASFEVVKERLLTEKRKNMALDLADAGTVAMLQATLEADRVFNTEAEAEAAAMRFGYDASNHKFVDMVDGGIIDPVKVTRYALEHAASVVGLMLTCNSIIVPEDEDER